MTPSSAYSFLSHLECSRTGERYDADVVQGTSAAGAPLLARYDLERVRDTVTPRDIAVRAPDLWRYHEVLPVRDERHVVSLGEGMTPLERLFAVADCANGIGSKLDITRWTFLNTDLAVHVFRVPDGEWVGIRAEASYGPDGIGTTIGTLFDEQGAVGAIQQSVLVRRRSGSA